MTIPAPTPTPAPIAVAFIPPPVVSLLSFSTVVRDGAGAAVGIVEEVDSLDDVVAERLEIEVSVFLVVLGASEELVVVESMVDSVEVTCLDSFFTQN